MRRRSGPSGRRRRGSRRAPRRLRRLLPPLPRTIALPARPSRESSGSRPEPRPGSRRGRSLRTSDRKVRRGSETRGARKRPRWDRSPPVPPARATRARPSRRSPRRNEPARAGSAARAGEWPRGPSGRQRSWPRARGSSKAKQRAVVGSCRAILQDPARGGKGTGRRSPITVLVSRGTWSGLAAPGSGSVMIQEPPLLPES